MSDLEVYEAKTTYFSYFMFPLIIITISNVVCHVVGLLEDAPDPLRNIFNFITDPKVETGVISFIFICSSLLILSE